MDLSRLFKIILLITKSSIFKSCFEGRFYYFLEDQSVAEKVLHSYQQTLGNNLTKMINSDLDPTCNSYFFN